jgi:hypothetical protein
MQFFEDLRGCRRPVADIKLISAVTKKAYQNGFSEDVYNVLLADGRNCDIADWQMTRLEQMPATMIAAAPGTYLLFLPDDYEGEQRGPLYSTVIAWGITGDGNVEPYTADGRNDGLSDGQPILFPNGGVVEQHNQSWSSEADWLHDVRQQRTRKEVAA